MSSGSTDTDSTVGSLKKQSLKAAGYAYLVGDAGLFVAGLSEKKYKDASVGLLWGLGGLAAARYGNPKAEDQLKVLHHKLSTFLKDEGIEVPKTPDAANLARPGGVIDKIESFLYTYPSQSLNAVYAIGGALLIPSGLALSKNKAGLEQRNYAKAGTGALITAGALAGLLLQEKTPDPNHKPDSMGGKIKQWAQEKPLRVSGTFYGLSNIGLVLTALKSKKDHPNNKTVYVAQFLTAASYIFANTMLRISSTGHGNTVDGNEYSKAMETLSNEAAVVIAAQPKETQEALVQQISGFLASQHEVTLKAPEIAAILHAKLKEVSIPPVSAKSKDWQERVQPNATTTSPAL